MDDIKKDPFEEYIRQTEPSRKELGYAWYTAMGLQAVDGLEPSEHLKDIARDNIDGKITLTEANKLIETYYEESAERDKDRSREAVHRCFFLMLERSGIITYRNMNGYWMVHPCIMEMPWNLENC